MAKRTNAPCCPLCGYNLTGLTEPRCPECGGRLTELEWEQLRTHGVALARPPHWERRDAPLLWRLPATLFNVTFRPGRFLRGLRGDGGVLRAVWFCILLVLLAPLVTILLCAALGYLGQILPFETLREGPFPHFLLHKKPLVGLGRWYLHVGAQTTAFIGAGLFVWLPTLIALDLRQWRSRPAFRVVAKGLLYTAGWCLWMSVIAAGPANGLLFRLGEAWVWGMHGWSKTGGWPWVCWVAATLTTTQFAAVTWVIRGPQSAFALENPSTRRRMGLLLTAGWLLGLYLLLFDRHVHLRFHLQFAGDDVIGLLQRWGL